MIVSTNFPRPISFLLRRIRSLPASILRLKIIAGPPTIDAFILRMKSELSFFDRPVFASSCKQEKQKELEEFQIKSYRLLHIMKVTIDIIHTSKFSSRGFFGGGGGTGAGSGSGSAGGTPNTPYNAASVASSATGSISDACSNRSSLRSSSASTAGGDGAS